MALRVGTKKKDGTIYVGEVGGKAVYAAPVDADDTMTLNEALEYAEMMNKVKYAGHKDWHIPTKEELNLLFENRKKGALKGTFNSAGTYRSSTTDGTDSAWCQDFCRSGMRFHYIDREKFYYNVRCVRNGR